MNEQHEDEMRGWRSRLDSDEPTKTVAVDLLTALGESERARLAGLRRIEELQAVVAQTQAKLIRLENMLNKEVWG